MVGQVKYRILVVEDQTSVRRLIALWLKRGGFAALEAANASQALAHFERKRRAIDLAIIDLVGTNGMDLAAQIDREYRRTQVLYISGFGDSVAVDAIGRRSPKSLLLKPLAERSLIDRVRSLLNPGGCSLKLEPQPEWRRPRKSLSVG